MENWKNSVVVESVLKALYTVASRRTSSKMAQETIGSSIKTLENKYDFLKYINPKKTDVGTEEFVFSISPDINTIHPTAIGKAIESLLRIVYNDIGNEAGLYFITELKENADQMVTKMVQNLDVDLDQIQLEQHYAYRRRELKKEIEQRTRSGKTSGKKPENLLGYTWDSVVSWRHEPGSKYCTLYNKEGRVVDRLNLDRIIKNYVEKLSGYVDIDPSEVEKETMLYEKEYKLLKLMLERDMDADTAMHMLKVSKEELDQMIRKLSEMEMLQFVSFDTIQLTEIGIGYLSKKQKGDIQQ